MLADAVPMRRDGRDLKQQVLELLAPLGARLVTVGDHDHEVHADMETVDAASAALAGAGCVVAVGSGTICDIGKKATEGDEPVPYVVVQTACSVNAFSDDMAVLLLHGAKRTMPSRWPDALVIDLGVIAEAPAALNQAGVGELSSMFTAPADWRLADLMGLDGGYDEAVVGLFRDDGEELEQVAAGVADRDPDALAWLCDRMTRGGLALGVVGQDGSPVGRRARHQPSAGHGRHPDRCAPRVSMVPRSASRRSWWRRCGRTCWMTSMPQRVLDPPPDAAGGPGAHRAHVRGLRPDGRDGRRVLAAVPAQAGRMDRRRRIARGVRG